MFPSILISLFSNWKIFLIWVVYYTIIQNYLMMKDVNYLIYTIIQLHWKISSINSILCHIHIGIFMYVWNYLHILVCRLISYFYFLFILHEIPIIRWISRIFNNMNMELIKFNQYISFNCFLLSYFLLIIQKDI